MNRFWMSPIEWSCESKVFFCLFERTMICCHNSQMLTHVMATYHLKWTQSLTNVTFNRVCAKREIHLIFVYYSLRLYCMLIAGRTNMNLKHDYCLLHPPAQTMSATICFVNQTIRSLKGNMTFRSEYLFETLMFRIHSHQWFDSFNDCL